jgi:transcriptional regulator with XRE-family HTH domain
VTKTVVDEATTPSTAKRRLGVALKDAREAAGLPLDEAARAIQRSAATLSRLERGRLQKPRLIEITALLTRYASANRAAVPSERRDQILRLTEHAAEPAWFQAFRDVLGGPMTADDAQRYIEFESDAAVIRSFEPEAVPGLLQTRGYAEAITDVFFPAYSPAERARFVELRLARQQVLDRGADPVRLDVVIGEVALRRRLTAAQVMREQLQHLLGYAEGTQPNVTLRVAPIELGHPAVYGGPYVVMDLADEDENGLVYLEGRREPQFVQSDDTVDEFRRLHHELTGVVLDAAQTAAIIKESIDGLN